ncbi:MAG: tetratricopeptide repeat protein, partial [Nitrospinaceae bacterium]|nr:tetratricopeptide repeat protein [Nitrospinaceae bacterium]NIR57975.1 tetratricopeptide repeat protein [Nitrospinaceae bacterium]NIS88438.1 tetratricopeptide repeat protein [Nitrospinaceae bacterium]NIT85313.1 tetratricopeptide repeat protein [Nitrospinaceae bacterium]NIU47469.1 tetratricopeptide repeat protein [Nitrospinaceae bacterium]
VVGKKEPVRIYEPLARKGELDGALRDLLPHYREGLQYYAHREWDRARVCFEAALGRNPDDGPSLTYYRRCIKFQKTPPPPDWDG